MSTDPSQFHVLNVADTCSLWNLLSSDCLYSAARDASCSFCCTSFVVYECLHKQRRKITAEDNELMQRLEREMDARRIVSYSLSIADLQDVELLESRQRLSKGELSSIAFAHKTRQAFLTDDQKARKLSETLLDNKMTQTTPHLFGWLIFSGKLSDTDKDLVIVQHEALKRPLGPYLEEMYLEGLRCRCMLQYPVREDIP